MTQECITPAWVERQDDAGLPGSILAALEREAAHLTRRDGVRRHVVRWGDEPPSVERVMDEDRYGLSILTTVDLV